MGKHAYYVPGQKVQSVRGFEADNFWVEKWVYGTVDSQGNDSATVAVRWDPFPERIIYTACEDIEPLKPAVPAITKPDMVNHPPHYTSSPAKCSKCGHGIECIDVVQHMNFSIGNAVKYLWRAGLKNDAIEDLKKAVWYINTEIAKREASGDQG